MVEIDFLNPPEKILKTNITLSLRNREGVEDWKIRGQFAFAINVASFPRGVEIGKGKKESPRSFSL